MTSRHLRTSDIAKDLGVHVNTIRFYESRGFLPAIPRGKNMIIFINHDEPDAEYGESQEKLSELAQAIEQAIFFRDLDRARAYLYQAELAVRLSNYELAQSSLMAVTSLELTDDERAEIADEFTQCD